MRGKVAGTASGVAVFRSNRGIEAQLSTTRAVALRRLVDRSGKSFKGDKSAQASAVGKLLAENAKKAGVEAVVFDRGGYLYHGRSRHRRGRASGGSV